MDDNMGFDLPDPEALGDALHRAISGMNFDGLKKQVARVREMSEMFPEHAKFAAVEREALLLHQFINHYLPTQGLMLARTDGTSYFEDTDAVLIPGFFGVDTKKFEEETPGVLAKVHQYESEDEAENPDPALKAQMDEFERMLAGEQEAES